MLYRFDEKQPEYGLDTYISETALIIGDVKIGDNCYIGHNVILRGDYGRIEIGSGTAVEEGVIVHVPPNSLCKIGKRVTLGHGAIIHSEEIGDSAVIGMGAIVSIKAKIGSWSIIAEGSVVKMNQMIPDKVVAAGNPSKIVRQIEERDISMWNDAKQLYINLAKKYLKIGMVKMD